MSMVLKASGDSRVLRGRYVATLAVGPSGADSVLGGGATVVTGGGALVVTGGALVVSGGGGDGGGALVTVGGELVTDVDGEVGTDGEVDVDIDGPDGVLVEGLPGGLVEGLVDGDFDVLPLDPGAEVSGVDGPDVEVPDGGGEVVSSPPGEDPSATLSITYCPNRISVPAGGSVAVTRALSAGTDAVAYPVASPLSASVCRASPKVLPARPGTASVLRVSKVSSFAPVVPTGRLIPRSGSSTSTRAIFSSGRAAGRTATTEERSYPFHSLFPSSNLTEIRFVSPVKGRSGFPQLHFTAGCPC